MPLHDTGNDEFNRQNLPVMDGIVEDEVLNNLERIKIYPIRIKSEGDLTREVARIANLPMEPGCLLEKRAGC